MPIVALSSQAPYGQSSPFSNQNLSLQEREIGKSRRGKETSLNYKGLSLTKTGKIGMRTDESA